MSKVRIQWFGHTSRQEETNKARAAIEYKPTGSRPKKRCISGVQQDLDKLEVTKWKKKIQDIAVKMHFLLILDSF